MLEYYCKLNSTVYNTIEKHLDNMRVRFTYTPMNNFRCINFSGKYFEIYKSLYVFAAKFTNTIMPDNIIMKGGYI